MSASILLVEDDEGYRYSLTKSLARAGYDVIVAGGYMEALDALEKNQHVALLLSDVVMPAGVNGFALARMARMRKPELKVMHLTAFDVPTGEALGKILKKPISDDELLAEVRDCLNG